MVWLDVDLDPESLCFPDSSALLVPDPFEPLFNFRLVFETLLVAEQQEFIPTGGGFAGKPLRILKQIYTALSLKFLWTWLLNPPVNSFWFRNVLILVLISLSMLSEGCHKERNLSRNWKGIVSQDVVMGPGSFICFSG